MPVRSVIPLSDRVTITVPAKYAERFRDEALFTFGSAAQNIEECSKFTRRAKRSGEESRHPIGGDDLNRLHEAERLFLQVRDQGGDLLVDAQPEILRSTAVGCALDAVEVLHGEVEAASGDVRLAMEELAFWESLRERLEGEGRS
jgi:hypothetical protein